MKKSTKVFALVCSLVLALSMFGIAAFAENNVNGEVISVDKYLIMDANANVPNAEFTFTLTAGTPIAANKADNKSAIVAGSLTGAKLTYGTDIDDASAVVPFAAGDATFAEQQDGDTVTLAADTKYAVKTFAVDLSGVTFTEPGVYRYVITETGTNDGITNDANNVRYLDVYVESDGTDLSITGNVLHTTDAVAANVVGATYGEDKDAGFSNSYATYDLTVSKDIEGNQGFRNKYFAMTVNIANAVAGTVYDVDLADAEATTSKGTNVSSITVGDDGTATATFYLKDDQSVIVRGLTGATTYVVSEDEEDYTPTYKIDGAETAEDGNTTGDAVAMGTQDHTVAFTNTRTGVVPTGIIVEFAPYIAIILLAVVGAALLIVKKRKSLSK